MINITINENGSTTPNIISLGSQFENLDDTIQFAFPSNLEGLNKYVVAKTYDDSKKENITRVTPLVDNKFVVGQAITKVTGQWLLYTLCKAYSPSGDVERVSISDPIVATVTENDFDISEIEADIDPNIKIIYDELKALKKELETNEATRQANETTRVEAENERVSNETARANAEQARQTNEAQRAENEVNRATAETARVNAETARTNAEAKRATAETARTTAEANRVIAEQSRVNAEKLRVTADRQREDNTNNAIKTMTDSTNKAIETLNEKIGIIDGLRTGIDANTKEIGKTSRSLTALWDLNKGISYRFEEDTTKAYQKKVPSGAKLGAVNTICGRTIVYNQYANINSTMKLWADNSGFYKNLGELSGHKLYIMNKCAVTKILYDKEIYYKRLILFNENDEGVINVGNTIIKKADMAVGKVFTNKEIAQAPSTLKAIRLYNIGDDETGLTAECDSWVNIIDLTQIFGSGNEPSTVEEFEAMFPLDYYPYSEGTLMSMGTKDVVEQGKNYFKCKSFSCGFYGSDTAHLSNVYGTSIDSTEPSNKVTVTQTKAENKDAISNYANGVFSVSLEPIKIDKQYIFSFEVTPTNMLISNPYIFPITKGLNFKIETVQQGLEVGKKTKLSFEISIGNIELTQIELRIGGISGVFENFQIEEGTTATAFTPYHEQTYTIPKAILDLEGYGWGVGDAYNYVDYEYKKFVKYVGRVDLGTLNFTYGTYGNDNNFYIFRALLPNDIKKDENAYLHTNNLLCSKYADTPWNDLWSNGTDKKITQTSNNINITDSSFTEAEAFKQSLQGVYLYYELAEPVVTDISDIIGDTFQEPFNVEGGGSLTFKNTNGDGYKLAVPSNVQYTIKLNEVTS